MADVGLAGGSRASRWRARRRLPIVILILYLGMVTAVMKHPRVLQSSATLKADTLANAHLSSDKSFYAARMVSDGATSLWRLDEDQGYQAVDSAGQVDGVYQGGVVLGSPSGVTGPATCASFDGMDDQIDLGNNYGFGARSPFSIELRMRLNAYSVSKSQALISRIDYNGGIRGWVLGVHRFDGGAVEGHVELERHDDPDGQQVYNTDVLITVATWYHIVATYDGIQMGLYVDGQGSTVSGQTADVSVLPQAQPLRLGNITDNSYIGGFNGSICNVAVYGRALTATEIAQHYAVAGL